MSKYFDGDKLSGYEDNPITYVYGSNLEECHKVIADLEAKLAKSEKKYEDRKQFCISEIRSQMEIINNLLEENEQLKLQLKEKERLIERLQGVIDKLRDKKFAGKTLVEAVNAVYEPLFKNKCDEVEEIKQQLKNQPAEIVEKIKQQLIKRLNTIAGYGRMTTDELSFLIETEFGSDLDNILKEYRKEKCKF